MKLFFHVLVLCLAFVSNKAIAQEIHCDGNGPYWTLKVKQRTAVVSLHATNHYHFKISSHFDSEGSGPSSYGYTMMKSGKLKSGELGIIFLSRHGGCIDESGESRPFSGALYLAGKLYSGCCSTSR